MTVTYMLEIMPISEFFEWIEYNSIEPFGEERDDYRTGIIASTIANVNRTKNSKIYTPDDFIPKFNNSDVKKEQTISQQLKIVELLNIALGGKDLRKK